jgi:hypothetical protein
VRLGVAFDAIGRGGEMKRPFLARVLNPFVTLEAVDAFDDVHAVLERVVFALLLEAEHLRASACEAGQNDEGRHRYPLSRHFPRHVC